MKGDPVIVLVVFFSFYMLQSKLYFKKRQQSALAHYDGQGENDHATFRSCQAAEDLPSTGFTLSGASPPVSAYDNAVPSDSGGRAMVRRTTSHRIALLDPPSSDNVGYPLPVVGVIVPPRSLPIPRPQKFQQAPSPPVTGTCAPAHQPDSEHVVFSPACPARVLTRPR
jgi:hypothetical protein